jgi:hypothetical protein
MGSYTWILERDNKLNGNVFCTINEHILYNNADVKMIFTIKKKKIIMSNAKNNTYLNIISPY